MLSVRGWRAAILCGVFQFFVPALRAENFVYTADKYRTNFETGETLLSGNVRVEYLDRVFFADEAQFNAKTQDLDAQGKVKVIKGELTITSERAKLNLKSGYGTFYEAILRSGSALYLEGREIEHYAKDRYRVYQGKASRCQDCPQAWSVTGASMDVEVEGFLEAHHALIQIKDVPVVYLPFYFLPLKTKRQSGFLWPRYYRFSELGNGISLPYYWVLGDSADTTFEYLYTDGVKNGAGHRMANEFLYSYSERSFVDTYNSYLVRSGGSRYGGSLVERWQLSPQWIQRFRSEYASDPRYSYQFAGEFPSARISSLDTEISLSHQSDDVFTYGVTRWHQDNLPRNTERLKELGFRQGSLHDLPELGLSVASFSVWGPVRGSWDLNYLRLERSGSPLDPLQNVGTSANPEYRQWIREGSRATSLFRLTAPIDVSVFQWKPKVELRADQYIFPSAVVPSQARRVRYLVDQTFGTQFSRAWQREGSELRAIKHIVEPYLRWSYSDRDWTSHHAFFDQASLDRTLRAPQFDLFDPNENIENLTFGTLNEEQRLRASNLFTFVLGTRLIGRYGEKSPTYETLISGFTSQDVDFYRRDPVTGQPTLGLFRLELAGGYGGIQLLSAVAHNWRLKSSNFSNNVSYSWQLYRLGVLQRIEGEIRYYGVYGSVSNWGPWSASAEYTYNDRSKVTSGDRSPQNAQSYRIEYSGSDSLCWYFNMAFIKGTADPRFNFLPQIGFVLNESGKKTSVNSMLNKSRSTR